MLSMDEKLCSWGRAVPFPEACQEGGRLDFRKEGLEDPNSSFEQPTSSRAVASYITQPVQKLNLSVAHFSHCSLPEQWVSTTHNHHDCYMFWQHQLLSKGFTYLEFKQHSSAGKFLLILKWNQTQFLRAQIQFVITTWHSSNNPIFIALLK